MNPKRNKWIFLAATGLLSLMMLGSAGMYFFNYEMVAETFVNLGYPTYVIYPLATAKVLGVVVLWAKVSDSLKEWAYAGFFFDFVLAISAHFNIQDGEQTPAMVALVLLFISYFFRRKMKTRLDAE